MHLDHYDILNPVEYMQKRLSGEEKCIALYISFASLFVCWT